MSEPYRYRSDSNPVADAWFDIVEGLRRHPLWVRLGLQEVNQLYRGSMLGAIWIIVSFLVFGAALIWFFGAISDSDANWFAAYLLLGFWVFQFASVSITSASTVFMAAEGWLQSQRLPLTLFVYKLVFRNVFNLILTGVAVVIAMIYLRHPMTWQALWAIPGVLLLIYNAVWSTLLIGLITTRIRDLQHIISTIMRFAFFVTPVLWEIDSLGDRGAVAHFNPLTHYIAIIRDPLLGDPISSMHWWVVLTITVIGSIGTFFAFARFRRSLIFWL
ncbi:ABC transporter permease [Oceanicaulis sp. LC35]|uniref:ABC transporter permease n=1 Tax=Oceanicaulis sp. LC35 TaxID=3349635 RepID=UPI003F842C48